MRHLKTILYDNRGQLFCARGNRRQDFERKFSKQISGVTPTNPLMTGAGYPTCRMQSHNPARLSAVRDQDHRAPLEVMVPQQEQTPGAANRAIGSKAADFVFSG